MHGAAVGAICIQTQNLRLVIREHNIEALHLLAAASHDTIVSIHSLLCRSKCAPSHHRIISHFLHISTDLLPINIAAFSSYLVPYHIFEKLFWTILRWFSAHENHYFIHMQRPYTELCIWIYIPIQTYIIEYCQEWRSMPTERNEEEQQSGSRDSGGSRGQTIQNRYYSQDIYVYTVLSTVPSNCSAFHYFSGRCGNCVE